MNDFIAGLALALGTSTTVVAPPVYGGQITWIDRGERMIHLEKGPVAAPLRAVPHRSQILLNEQPAALDELQAGDRVNVRYDIERDLIEIHVTRVE